MNTLSGPLVVTSINAQAADVTTNAQTRALGNVVIVGPGGMLGTPRRDVVPVGTPGDGVFGQRFAIEVAHTLQRGESYRIAWDTMPAYPIAVAISGYREEVL